MGVPLKAIKGHGPKGGKPKGGSSDPIKHCLGPGPEMFWMVDTQHIPGKLIMHFVRFSTIVIPDSPEFMDLEFKGLHHTNDPRLEQFIKSVRIHESDT